MSAEFVAHMEDVLDLYAEPHDPQRPVVCFDETSKQLVSEKREPIPAKAGRRERFDYEYQRNGTRNLFMGSWRHVEFRGTSPIRCAGWRTLLTRGEGPSGAGQPEHP